MKHCVSISKSVRARIPASAGQEQVCGTFTLTGQVKCVDRDSPKAAKIEDIPVE